MFSLLAFTTISICIFFIISDFLLLQVLFLKIQFLKIYLFRNLPCAWLALFLYCIWHLCLLQHYSVRLIIYGIFWRCSVDVNKIMKLHMNHLEYILWLPLIVLSFFSIFIGYLTKVYFYWNRVLLFLVSAILNLLFKCN